MVDPRDDWDDRLHSATTRGRELVEKAEQRAEKAEALAVRLQDAITKMAAPFPCGHCGRLTDEACVVSRCVPCKEEYWGPSPAVLALGARATPPNLGEDAPVSRKP